MLLLLVQNDEAGSLTGGEHRASGAHHHSGLPTANPFPLVVAFCRTQRGVQNRHLLPEIGSQKAKKLGGQGNLRHQQNGCLSLFQTGLNQLNIHRGLPGTGDAVKQSHPGLFLCHLFL